MRSFPRRGGEWPFVAGLGVAAGLFGAAHLAGASSNSVDTAIRSDLGKELHGVPAMSRIEEVKGAQAIVTVGSRRYTLVGSSHTPRAGENWQVAVTAMEHAKPMDATVRADAMLNGNVVQSIAHEPLREGVYVAHFPWPAKAVGVPLVLRFTITKGGDSQTFFYAVRVRPAGG
jgi:hypothetical protein